MDRMVYRENAKISCGVLARLMLEQRKLVPGYLVRFPVGIVAYEPACKRIAYTIMNNAV